MKISTIELTDTEKQALEQGYKLGETAVYRQLVSFLTPKPMKIGWG
ncbi:hypothetical protein ACF3N0_02245 [Moraxella atlantae]